MSKSKKIVCIILLIIIVLLVVALCFVMPKDNEVKIGLNTEEKIVKAGETVSVEAEIENLQDNIYTIQGFLEYDENTFEQISNENIENQNDWVTVYDENSKMLISGRNKETSKNAPIMILNLKAKNDINIDETTIKIVDLEVSGLDYNQILDDSQVHLKIKK